MENDMVQLLNNVSYRKADQLDMLEMIMAKTRLEYALSDHRKICRMEYYSILYNLIKIKRRRERNERA